ALGRDELDGLPARVIHCGDRMAGGGGLRKSKHLGTSCWDVGFHSTPTITAPRVPRPFCHLGGRFCLLYLSHSSPVWIAVHQIGRALPHAASHRAHPAQNHSCFVIHIGEVQASSPSFCCTRM